MIISNICSNRQKYYIDINNFLLIDFILKFYIQHMSDNDLHLLFQIFSHNIQNERLKMINMEEK